MDPPPLPLSFFFFRVLNGTEGKKKQKIRSETGKLIKGKWLTTKDNRFNVI